MPPRLRLIAAILLAVLGLGGCGTLGYYFQAVNGQLEVLGQAQPIQAVLDDPHAPEKLKGQLAEVARIRDYASAELGLPDNGSFRRYADLKRPYVVWNVFAAPEFSTAPKEWCYLFVGCAHYRGYFSEAAAEAAADELRRQGYDVYVAGIPAYSTLGWFDDPVLNTVIDFPVVQLAPLIFHELAHQVAYARGDTAFNESFAVAVAREGMRRWLARFGGGEQGAAFAAAQERRAGFTALVGRYHDRLERLYASPLPADEKRAAKAAALREMREDYGRLKAAWQGHSGYDKWFAQEINNAQLASVTLYTKLVPAFEALLARDGGDLPRFYRHVRSLAALPAAERAAALGAGQAMPDKDGGGLR